MKRQVITYKSDISRFIKRLLRQSVGAHNNCPVAIVDGNKPPKFVGNFGHYENKSGDEIRHPNAYRRAWGKPIYIHSTVRVEVGSEWLLKNLSLESVRLYKLRAFL